MKYEEFIKKSFEEILNIASSKTDKSIYDLALSFYNDEDKMIKLIEKNPDVLKYIDNNKTLLYKLIEFKYEKVLCYFKDKFKLQDYDKSFGDAKYNILNLLIKNGCKKTIEECLEYNNEILNIKDKQTNFGVELLINANYSSILYKNAKNIKLYNKDEYGHYIYNKLLKFPEVIKEALKNHENLVILNKRNDSGKSGVQIFAENGLKDILLEYAFHINLNVKSSNSYKTVLADLVKMKYSDVIMEALKYNNNTDVLNKRNDIGEPGSEVLAKGMMECVLIENAKYIDITVKNSNGHRFVINDLIYCPKALNEIISYNPEALHKKDGYGKTGVQILAENKLENILLNYAKGLDLSIKDSSGYKYILNSLIKFPKVLDLCYSNEKNLNNINMKDDYGKTNVEVLIENDCEEILKKSYQYINLKEKSSNYKYNFHYLMKYPEILNECLKIDSSILNKKDDYGNYCIEKLINENLDKIIIDNIKSINWDVAIKGYPIKEYLVKEKSPLLMKILKVEPSLINIFIKEIINKDDVNRYLNNDNILYMLDDKLKVKNINIMALLASKQYENHVERYYKIKKDNKYQQEENIISNEEVKMKLNEMISSKEIKNQEQRNKKDELIKHKNNDENIRINKKGESIIKKEDIGFKKYKKML